jgi:hypothetical protein
MLKLTHREPVETASKNLALSCRSVHESQHCTKGSTQRNSGVALSGPDYHRMEVYWFPIVDPWKTYVSVIISGERLLRVSDYRSGLWEKRHLVRFPALLPVATYLFLLVPPSSRTLRPYAKLDQRSWPIFTSISRTSESKPVTTCCALSYFSSLLTPVHAATFFTGFMRHTKTVLNSQVTTP